MCTMAIATGLSVASSIWSGYSGYQNAQAQAAAATESAESQARVLEYNASQARGDAARVSETETEADLELRQRQRAVRGQQAVAAGASGTALSGSYSDIALGTAVTQEQDLSALRRNYANQRMSYLNQAQSYEYQAANTRIAGQNQASAIKSSGTSGLLGSLLTAGGTYLGSSNSIFTSGAKKTTMISGGWGGAAN